MRALCLSIALIIYSQFISLFTKAYRMHARVPKEDHGDYHSDDSFHSEDVEVNEEMLSSARWATRGLAKVENEDNMTEEMRSKVSNEDRIVARRGAFRWLPALCCNDIVHGSWYVTALLL